LEQEMAAQRAAFEKVIGDYEKVMADAKAEKEARTDPTIYEKKKREAFSTFLQKVEVLPDPPKTEKPSVAVIGRNGVGKSTLINALVGEEVTETGAVDTTKVITKCYESQHTAFFDVPGDTPERSYYNLESLMKFREMHLILLVYSERVDWCLDLFRMLKALKVPRVVVRTKTDVDVTEKKAKRRGKTLEEFKQGYFDDDFCFLKELDPEVKLCFVSGEEGDGIEDLRKAAVLAANVSLQPDL